MSFRLADIEFFVGVCHAISVDKHSWKEIADWLKEPENVIVMEKRGRRTTDRSALRKWMTDLEDHFKEPLLLRGTKGAPVGLTPRGDRLYRLTAPLIPHFKLMWTNPKLAASPVLIVGTANTFELHLLCEEVITNWYAWLEANVASWQLINLTVREAYSRYQGLQEIEEGRWDVFIDGMVETPESVGNLISVPLGCELGLVVLVPNELTHLLDKPVSSTVTLKDLRKLPLCYVDVRGLGDRLLASEHRARRIALASNEGARILAEKRTFATVCVGWSKMLPSDYNNRDKYLTVGLAESWSVVQLVAMVRKDPPASPLVESFVERVKDYLEKEANRTDKNGNPTGILPISQKSPEPKVRSPQRGSRPRRGTTN